jgi:hypothetical protein
LAAVKLSLENKKKKASATNATSASKSRTVATRR